MKGNKRNHRRESRGKQKIEGLRNWEDISDTACHKEDRLNSLLKQKTKSPLIRGRRNHSIHNVIFTGQAKKWQTVTHSEESKNKANRHRLWGNSCL